MENTVIPKVPDAINMDMMTDEKIHKKLQKGYEDIEVGKVKDVASAFVEFRENHRNEF